MARVRPCRSADSSKRPSSLKKTDALFGLRMCIGVIKTIHVLPLWSNVSLDMCFRNGHCVSLPLPPRRCDEALGSNLWSCSVLAPRLGRTPPQGRTPWGWFDGRAIGALRRLAGSLRAHRGRPVGGVARGAVCPTARSTPSSLVSFHLHPAGATAERLLLKMKGGRRVVMSFKLSKLCFQSSLLQSLSLAVIVLILFRALQSLSFQSRTPQMVAFSRDPLKTEGHRRGQKTDGMMTLDKVVRKQTKWFFLTKAVLPDRAVRRCDARKVRLWKARRTSIIKKTKAIKSTIFTWEHHYLTGPY